MPTFPTCQLALLSPTALLKGKWIYFSPVYYFINIIKPLQRKTMFHFPPGSVGEEWRENGTNGGEEETCVPFFSYALLPPILPLLPVLALKKSRAMLRCQIKRLKKTDTNEPFRKQMFRYRPTLTEKYHQTLWEIICFLMTFQ
jgi:hypothetical protein